MNKLELHNRLAVEIVVTLLRETKAAGGDVTDLILMLASIVAGTIERTASSHRHAEALLATFMDEVPIRLEQIRAKMQRPVLN